MTHSIESMIWHMAFIIQHGGLAAGSAMVVALLAATLCELVVEKMHRERIPAPAVVREASDRSIIMNV